MSRTREAYRIAAASYGIVGDELDAFAAGAGEVTPHPQTPNAYAIWRPERKEAARKYATMELLLDTWSNPQNPRPIGMTVCIEGESIWLDGSDLDALARSFISLLMRVGAGMSQIVVWAGRGVVFHSFLRHIARPLTLRGVTVRPFVSGVDIKGVALSLPGMSWVLMDSGAMSGLTRLDQDAFCTAFGGGLRSGERNVERLYRAVGVFQNHLLRAVGVGIRPTIGAVSLKAARYHLPEGQRWFRPNLALESVCRFGGAYRGGYVHSEPYEGPAWRIDVNKMYTHLLRSPLPAHSTLGYAGKKGQEYPGIYLCRVEGEGHFPGYVSAFDASQSRFHKKRLDTLTSWCFLPSAELMGLRAIGYDVTAGLGFRFDRWVTLRPYADHLLDLQTRYERGSPESLVAKSLGNALTGKFGQSPERLDVAYSITEPRGGWLPFVTAEREVISDLWIKRTLDFKGGQHVDAAAWLTAQGRGKVYARLAQVEGLGWRAVHVDTDGIILDADPRGVLSLSADRPGAWRYDGFDPDCLVSRSKWFSFRGEVHTAGLMGMSREQLEAVHYGRKVTIGRKVLSNPFREGDAYREQYYQVGA